MGCQSGAPQGGVASPILPSTYLHKLDQFVDTVLYRSTPEASAGRVTLPTWSCKTSWPKPVDVVTAHWRGHCDGGWSACPAPTRMIRDSGGCCIAGMQMTIPTDRTGLRPSRGAPVRIVYSRSSTATQSLLRQRHILTEAGLLIRTDGVAEGFHPAEGVLLFEDSATTSKIPALQRPAFARVASPAHPSDTLTELSQG